MYFRNPNNNTKFYRILAKSTRCTSIAMAYVQHGKLIEWLVGKNERSASMASGIRITGQVSKETGRLHMVVLQEPTSANSQKAEGSLV